MSAIMMSQITVTDPEAFQDYLAKTLPVASGYGAELVFKGRLNGTLNGETAAHQMVVIARFADMDTIEAWHASPEYQALIPLREQGSQQTMITYEELS